jgi:hypothetical protein
MPRWLLTVLKWSGICIVGIVTLVGGVGVIAYAVNAHDEGLSAQAKAFLAAPANDLKPEDNLYLALAGLSAPSGAPTTAAGLATVEHYARAAPLVLTNHDEYQRLTAQDPAALKFVGAARFCRTREGSVWSDAPAHESEVARLRADNAELYARYLALPRQPGFYDVAMPRAQVPLYPASDLRCLFLADVALRLRSEAHTEREDALGALVRDIFIWRTVLTGQGDLLAKMIAIAYLHGDYLVLADAIADPAFAMPEVADANLDVPLFELAAWNIAPVFPVELRFFMNTVGTAAEEEKSRFFQPNATANLRSAHLARVMQVSGPNADNAAALARLEREPQASPWMHLYNPVGQILVAIGTGSEGDYVRRAWDGAALQRLARLGYEIRHRGIPADGVAAFMQAHPELATHPGDGRAFEYDPAAHELRMHPLARQPKESERRYAIPAWQVPRA